MSEICPLTAVPLYGLEVCPETLDEEHVLTTSPPVVANVSVVPALSDADCQFFVPEFPADLEDRSGCTGCSSESQRANCQRDQRQPL
jgi:hypothetical protein